MRRPMSPGALIGIVFLLAALMFGGILFAAFKGRTVASVATAPPAAAAAPTPIPPQPTVSIAALTKAPGATQFGLDLVNQTPITAPQTTPIVIPRTAAITISGWAYDQSKNAPAGGVVATADNTTSVRADYGSDRPDVADFHQNPALKPSGFRATFSPGMLAVGKHTITIEILTSDRTAYYLADRTIDIEVT